MTDIVESCHGRCGSCCARSHFFEATSFIAGVKTCEKGRQWHRVLELSQLDVRDLHVLSGIHMATEFCYTRAWDYAVQVIS